MSDDDKNRNLPQEQTREQSNESVKEIRGVPTFDFSEAELNNSKSGDGTTQTIKSRDDSSTRN